MQCNNILGLFQSACKPSLCDFRGCRDSCETGASLNQAYVWEGSRVIFFGRSRDKWI